MRTLWLAAVPMVILAAGPVHAQFIVGRPGAVAVTRGGFALGFHGRNLTIGAFSSRTSIVGYGGYPVGGFYGYAYAGPWLPPPVVVAPPPIVVVQPIIIQVKADEPKVPDPDRFLVIRPDRPKDALPGAPLVRVEKKAKEVDLGIAPGAFPLARGPAADPRVEAGRQIHIGKTVFSKSEFGRALERFRQATTLLPDEAPAWFLLAQAQFAVGKYDDAVASIVSGLKRQPDWPLSPFRSRDLYRAIPPAYDPHLQNLRNALAADPDDPRLLFLLGVQLWFDGKRDEARPLFIRAARLANDPAPAEAFAKVKD